MKKLSCILLSLALLLAVGCQTDKVTYEKVPSQATMQSSSFNQEHYVWESFLFPTNRTTGAQ